MGVVILPDTLNYHTFRQRRKMGISKSVRIYYKDNNHKRQRRLPSPSPPSGQQRKQHLEIRCRQLMPRHRRRNCYKRLQLQRPSRSNRPLRSVLLMKTKTILYLVLSVLIDNNSKNMYLSTGRSNNQRFSSFESYFIKVGL